MAQCDRRQPTPGSPMLLRSRFFLRALFKDMANFSVVEILASTQHATSMRLMHALGVVKLTFITKIILSKQNKTERKRQNRKRKRKINCAAGDKTGRNYRCCD